MNKTTAKGVLADLLEAYNECTYSAYFYDHGDVVCEAVECILREQPRWISVEERLPEQEQTVLLICKNGSRFCGFYRFDYVGEVQWKIWTALGSARCLNKGRVSHWMPLPAPPEVEV